MVNKLTDRDLLLQIDWRNDWIPNVGRQPWTTVYESVWGESDHFGIYSALIPADRIQTVLQDTSWDARVGDGHPGFVIYGVDRDNPIYLRNGRDDGVEPLVLYREFHGIRQNYLEVSEEFRLFHNLYWDAATNTYLKFDEAGEPVEVVRVREKKVEIRTRELKQFIAAKQVYAAIFLDSVRFSAVPIDEVSEDERRVEIERSDARFGLYVGDADFKYEYATFSRLLGKKIIAPPAVDQCGKWPYDERDDKEVSFIIGTDENGRDIEFTSNPDALSNYFGANPGAPHYLTPVFFRREVLTKYYADTEKYSVSDSYLRCAALWGLRLDNNHDKFVIVFLGDLGRDLPLKERLYWRSFNVQPEGSMSEVYFRRSFLAEFADPTSPDLVFKAELSRLHELWEARFGWPLMLPLDSKDEHLLTALHVPVNASQGEFDTQVLALTKILIDSLNEEEISRNSGGHQDGDKGITKFERFLNSQSEEVATAVIPFFRDLQALRSSGVGHRKGSKYARLMQRSGLEDKSIDQSFAHLLELAVGTLRRLQELARVADTSPSAESTSGA